MPTVDDLATRWEWALEAGGRALDAAANELVDAPTRRSALSAERQRTLALLEAVARQEHVHSRPWLPAAPITPRALGLPGDVRGCVFDVDGVLADSGVVHARAWAQVLDDVLLRRTRAHGPQFVPFDPVVDYRSYLDGRPRLDGVRAFLASRGISVPVGSPDDPPGAETAHGIAAGKGVALEHTIHNVGVVALPGARPYLLAAAYAHLRRAVVSTSATTAHVLAHAELDTLLEATVDAAAMAEAGLRPRPAPDMLLAACTRLGVAPHAAVSITRSAAGVDAAAAAGMRAIGIAHGDRADELAAHGAERVAASLEELLDPQLRTRG